MKTSARFLAVFLAALFTTVSAFAGDPTGTWTWTRQGRDGQTAEVTGKLQFVDGKLTGTVTGFQGRENPISEGKLEGDQLSFKVVVDFNGNTFTVAYQGKLDGDTITGTITRPNRDGGMVTTDWKATRKTG